MYSQTMFGAVAAATFGLSYVAGLAVFDRPTIDLISVGYDSETGLIRYERRVNASGVVRSPFHGDVVDVATEREVPECVSDGRADYGPNEDQVQFFTFEQFHGAGCKAALVPGTEYVIWATVSPIAGEGDSVRSKPFIWGE